MKITSKYLIVLLAAHIGNYTFCNAQITYEHSYFTTPATLGQEFFLTNLGNEDYKYVIYDYDSARFSLYNIDHTPYLLNIQIPIVSNPSTNTYYRLGYITKDLFDCDSTNIEYAMMLSTPRPNEHPNFAVYRTDGTVLFSKDSVGTVFCIGCGSGSWEMHPIMSTSAGTKLYLFYGVGGSGNEYMIFSLCGQLPEALNEISQTDFYVTVYPVPSSHEVNFKVNCPSSTAEYDLTIFNSSLQLVKTYKINGDQTQINAIDASLSSGTYFFTFQNKTKIYQTGKFIISK